MKYKTRKYPQFVVYGLNCGREFKSEEARQKDMKRMIDMLNNNLKSV